MNENTFVRDDFRTVYNKTFTDKGLDYITAECQTLNARAPYRKQVLVTYKYVNCKTQTLTYAINACREGPLFKVQQSSCGRYCSNGPYSVYSNRPYTFDAIKPIIDAVLNDQQYNNL